MTVNDLYELCQYTDIKVMSAYNGKVLCKAYRPKNPKHEAIGIREVTSIWSEILTIGSLGFGNMAKSIVCAYVYGDKEASADRGSLLL